MIDKLYIIRDNGEIVNRKKNRALTATPARNGYLQVSVFGKHELVHRLVAMKFIPNPNNLPEVNHKDGNKLNNNASNLEWISRLDNMRHAWASGLFGDHNKGSKNPSAKLNESLNSQIKIMYSHGNYTMRDLAKQFNVSCSTICYIINGKTWIS